MLVARTARGRAAAAALSRDRVVDEAVLIVAERGLAGLSMRLLAQRCGIGTMTLYGFVATKDELVGAIGNRILDPLALPDATLPWQERLRRLSRGLRTALGAHPELAQIFATQHINGDAAYRAAEVAMTAFGDAGLDAGGAVAAFTAFNGFVIGFVQQQAAQAGGAVPLDRRLAGLAALPRAQYPAILAAGADFLNRTDDSHFAAGLEFLIDGIRRDRRTASTTTTQYRRAQ
jgi:AcrR family transcriptional regulator